MGWWERVSVDAIAEERQARRLTARRFNSSQVEIRINGMTLPAKSVDWHPADTIDPHVHFHLVHGPGETPSSAREHRATAMASMRAFRRVDQAITRIFLGQSLAAEVRHRMVLPARVTHIDMGYEFASQGDRVIANRSTTGARGPGSERQR